MEEQNIEQLEKRLQKVEYALADQREMMSDLRENSSVHEVLLAKLEMLQNEIKHMSDQSNKQHNELADKVDQIRTVELPKFSTEIALLKLKSGAWGAIGSIVAVACLLLLEFLKKSIKS
jgi:hypothetical protein